MSACYNSSFLNAGKTLLAKAVANQTSATFLRVCGSELIQKYQVSLMNMCIFYLYAEENVSIPV